MPVLRPVRQFTPIRPRAGGETHLTAMHLPTSTVCGIRCRGWIVPPIAGRALTLSEEDVTCERCKRLISPDKGRK